MRANYLAAHGSKLTQGKQAGSAVSLGRYTVDVMTATATLEDRVIDPAYVESLFAWWEGLDTPYTRGTSVRDWDCSQYEDAVLFCLRGQVQDGFLLRGRAVVHFDVASDSVENVYYDMPPAGTESVSIIRRAPRRAS
jgi:hypothetical protein